MTPHLYPPTILKSVVLGQALWQQSQKAFGYLQVIHMTTVRTHVACGDRPALLVPSSSVHVDTRKTCHARPLSDLGLLTAADNGILCPRLVQALPCGRRRDGQCVRDISGQTVAQRLCGLHERPGWPAHTPRERADMHAGGLQPGLRSSSAATDRHRPLNCGLLDVGADLAWPDGLQGGAAKYNREPIQGWLWWAYNENSGDTGGIVTNNWQVSIKASCPFARPDLGCRGRRSPQATQLQQACCCC